MMHWNKTFFSLLTKKHKRVRSAINVFELGLRSVCCRSSRASRPQCEYEVCSEQLPPQLCGTWHSFWLITQKESVVVVFRISSNLFQLLFSDNDFKSGRLTSDSPRWVRPCCLTSRRRRRRAGRPTNRSLYSSCWGFLDHTQKLSCF